MNFVVGLTGGIGSGKTLVSDYFSKLGAPIIDTDIIARTIVAPGQPALKELEEAFGRQILLADGSLNRDEMRKIAFASEQNRHTLDSITHPAIRSETFQQIGSSNYSYCVVVVPLLVPNSEFSKLMQRILVVTAQRETKAERIKKRSQITELEIEQIMQSQIEDQERLSFADDVIHNDGSIDQAYEQVEELHKRYLDLSLGHSEG